MSQEEPNGKKLEFGSEPKAHAYTDGASGGSRGPGGYGAVLRWKGKTQEISGGEQNTTNQRLELTAACVDLEKMDEGQVVTVYSVSSYLINCMRRGWYKKWRENGWLNHPGGRVANRDLWERLLEATKRHREVRWRKVKGHSKTAGPHKIGNDRADELAVAAKKEANRERRTLLQGAGSSDVPRKLGDNERAQTSRCWEVAEWAGCTTWQRGWSTLLRGS